MNEVGEDEDTDILSVSVIIDSKFGTPTKNFDPIRIKAWKTNQRTPNRMRQQPRVGILSLLKDSDVVILDGKGCGVSGGDSEGVWQSVISCFNIGSVTSDGVLPIAPVVDVDGLYDKVTVLVASSY